MFGCEAVDLLAQPVHLIAVDLRVLALQVDRVGRERVDVGVSDLRAGGTSPFGQTRSFHRATPSLGSSPCRSALVLTHPGILPGRHFNPKVGRRWSGAVA